MTDPSQHRSHEELVAEAGGDFVYFVTRMGLQALIALGVLENPITGEKRRDADQARLVHSDLSMLRERTQGNLSPEESAKLDELLETLGEQLAQG